MSHPELFKLFWFGFIKFGANNREAVEYEQLRMKYGGKENKN